MTEAPKHKGEKSLKDAEMPPLPFAHQLLKSEINEPEKEVITLKDANNKIKKMRKAIEEAQKNLDEVYRLAGWSPKAIEAFVTDPKNFTPSEWETLNKQRKETTETLMRPQDIQRFQDKFNKAVANAQSTINDPRLAKERRKKGAGMRRNWLPMR